MRGAHIDESPIPTGCPAARCTFERYGADAGPSRKLVAARAPLTNISEGEFNIGLFVVAGNSSDRGATPWHGMMIQNHDAANFRFATVEWAVAGGDNALGDSVMEIDASDGSLKPVVDAAPHVRGFQIVLAAGAGRLYIFDRAIF